MRAGRFKGLERYLSKYNQVRTHSSLDRMTPDEFYFSSEIAKRVSPLFSLCGTP